MRRSEGAGRGGARRSREGEASGAQAGPRREGKDWGGAEGRRGGPFPRYLLRHFLSGDLLNPGQGCSPSLPG